jgi:hypothetical protein
VPTRYPLVRLIIRQHCPGSVRMALAQESRWSMPSGYGGERRSPIDVRSMAGTVGLPSPWSEVPPPALRTRHLNSSRSVGLPMSLVLPGLSRGAGSRARQHSSILGKLPRRSLAGIRRHRGRIASVLLAIHRAPVSQVPSVVRARPDLVSPTGPVLKSSLPVDRVQAAIRCPLVPRRRRRGPGGP